MKFTGAIVVVVLAATAMVGCDAADRCDTAVSLKPNGLNSDCRKMCFEKKEAEFKAAKCDYKRHLVDPVSGWVSVEPGCFETMIYGNITATWYLQHPPTHEASPALCQTRCQNTEDCAYWAWTTERYGKPEDDSRLVCHILLREDLEDAIGFVTDGGAIHDPKHCSKWIFDECTGPDPKCLNCEGTNRCGMESHFHVSGWKHCLPSRDVCDPFDSITTTPTPKPETPVHPTQSLPASKPTKPLFTTDASKPTKPLHTTDASKPTKPLFTTAPSTDKPGCESNGCNCPSGSGCGCCKGVVVRVMDRPKHMELVLEN